MTTCPQHPRWPVIHGKGHCVQCAINRGEHPLPEKLERKVIRAKRKRMYATLRDKPAPKPRPKRAPNPCSDCGEPTVRPNAKRCITCHRSRYADGPTPQQRQAAKRRKARHTRGLKRRRWMRVDGLVLSMRAMAARFGKSRHSVRYHLDQGCSDRQALARAADVRDTATDGHDIRSHDRDGVREMREQAKAG